METNYKLEGTPGSPVLILSNSLGSGMSIWDDVVPMLLPYFRLLRYDTRGHGGSEIVEGSYKIDHLGQDVIDLMDELGIQRAHFCGISMGGLIGQWIGIHHPQRLNKLILSNTAAKIGTIERWNDRIDTVNSNGVRSITEATMERWFTGRFRKNKLSRLKEIRAMFDRNHPDGYCGCCAAIRDADFKDDLNRISVHTLVITGAEDMVTTVEHAYFLAKNIPHATVKVLSASHLLPVELPGKYAELVIDFIVGTSTSDRGMYIRRMVLSDDHVDNTINNINLFNADFQELITTFPWGSVWSRPDLSRQERSLITLSMLIALNRKEEFKMHIKAALNNGVTVDQIREVIIQSTIYCGFPAANEAFRIAENVLKESGIDLNK